MKYEFAVSVIVPVYNAELFIDETIRSILAQDFQDFEILLVDDCSTDATAQRIAPYLNERVRYFREIANCGGPSGPRNTGIRNARGKYVAIFDADDVMLPGKLRDAVDSLERYPQAGLLFANFQSIDERGKLLSDDFLAGYTRFRRRLVGLDARTRLLRRGDGYRELLRANFIGTSSVVIPRAVFDVVGDFDETLANGDDYELWLRIALAYDLLFVTSFSHQYRLQPQSISFRGARNSLNRIRVLEKQFANGLSFLSRRHVRYWIADNYRQMGFAELQNGNGGQARRNFARSMRHQITLTAVKGYVETWVPGKNKS